MRRADRLFRIVQLLRSGRLLTAERLAQKLEVSPRTVYRDVRDLQIAGTPIEGEPGVGYTLRRDLDLPPLMFSREELTALVLGARLVAAWGGTENVRAARSALTRIEAVLPLDLRDRLDTIQLFSPTFQMAPEHRDRLDLLQTACTARNLLRITYTREDGQPSTRTLRPLALYFWTGVWTLLAWCDLRQDFRSFRLDRIRTTDLLPEIFTSQPGQQLADFLRRIRSEPLPERTRPTPLTNVRSPGDTIASGSRTT